MYMYLTSNTTVLELSYLPFFIVCIYLSIYFFSPFIYCCCCFFGNPNFLIKGGYEKTSYSTPL